MATTDIDKHVGHRIRQRRTILGISQTALAEGAGITFQQVQKYEKGVNRISMGRLCNFAQQLDVPIAYFLEEMPLGRKGKPLPAKVADDPLAKRDVLEMVKAFAALPKKHKVAVRAFLRAMAS